MWVGAVPLCTYSTLARPIFHNAPPDLASAVPLDQVVPAGAGFPEDRRVTEIPHFVFTIERAFIIAVLPVPSLLSRRPISYAQVRGPLRTISLTRSSPNSAWKALMGGLTHGPES